MYERLQRMTGAEWCTWIAAAAAIVGAVVAIVAPAGSPNRVAGVAVPLAIAAALLVANSLAWERMGGLGAAIYGVAALALMYGILLAMSVPVRLAVEGTCPRSASSCPIGFDYPISSGESFAVYTGALAGALALVLVFIAFEARHLHRSRRPPQLTPPTP